MEEYSDDESSVHFDTESLDAPDDEALEDIRPSKRRCLRPTTLAKSKSADERLTQAAPMPYGRQICQATTPKPGKQASFGVATTAAAIHNPKTNVTALATSQTPKTTQKRQIADVFEEDELYGIGDLASSFDENEDSGQDGERTDRDKPAGVDRDFNFPGPDVVVNLDNHQRKQAFKSVTGKLITHLLSDDGVSVPKGTPKDELVLEAVAAGIPPPHTADFRFLRKSHFVHLSDKEIHALDHVVLQNEIQYLGIQELESDRLKANRANAIISLIEVSII